MKRITLPYIESAIKKDRLRLHAQPIVDIQRKTAFSELLIRIENVTGGIISAGQFIGLAEASGLIRTMDDWVVREAIGIIDVTGDKFSINISPQSIGGSTFLPFLKRQLETHNIDPGSLMIEFLETIPMSMCGNVLKIARMLRKGKHRFSLDDVGHTSAGKNSWLFFLKQLEESPPDFLKLDGCFVQNLKEPQNQQTVEAVVKLGIPTIAEYVEDQQTMLRLIDLGVRYFQGFFTGPPGPIAKGQ